MRTAEAEEAAPVSGRHYTASGPSRRWMVVFCSLLGLSLVAAAVLTYVGVRTVRASRAGTVVSTVTDPTAPGFEAFLEPTPTLGVLHLQEGNLVGMTVLALGSGDVGGSALAVPAATYGRASDQYTFQAVQAYSGSDAVLTTLQRALDLGITELAVVDDARWAELVAPVAPLSFEGPSAAGPFPAGPITLEADQVGPYLAATAEGEGPAAAALRQRALLQAWFDAIGASSDPAAVPGEVASGLGRFVRGVAAGPHVVETAPVAMATRDGAPRPEIDDVAVAALVPALVPFPTAGEPLSRVRVRLLDGTGDPDQVQRQAPRVTPADAEIVRVGNADRFDYRETELRYHHPSSKRAAIALQRSLGVGRLVDDPRQTDAFDVTIVLGADVEDD